MPSLLGTKIMDVGHLLLVYTLSWPAPLVISRYSRSSPSTDFAAALTDSIQSSWNSTAGDSKSVVQVTDNGNSCWLPCGEGSASTEPPRARIEKSRFSSASTASTISSAAARMSRLNRTWPGTVFTLPGESVRMPVEASAACLVATRLE